MPVLENYYDRTRADEWGAVFDGTDIGREPTDDRSRYVILRFNFSAFDDTLDGEKVVHAFLAAHFSLVGHFLIRSERELNKGYADLHLEPFLARHPDVRYGYVIELKYLRRGEAADGDAVASRLREARAQLRGYLADEGLRRLRPAVRHVGVALVFHGWELTACEAVGDEDTGG